jgi:CRISPR-associated protein Csm1
MVEMYSDDMQQKSHQAALIVAQEAVVALLQWADSGATLPEIKPSNDADISSAVQRAKGTLNFAPALSQIGALRLLFDDVKLPDGQGKLGAHWCPMRAIADANPQIPYPLTQKPTNKAEYQKEVAEMISPIIQDSQKWGNLSLLSLILEKYASCLSFGESNVALVDVTRITGAVAATLAQNPDATQLSLVAGDLSGIQDFIYTISSAGALKSLRARSFYLELVTEEVVQQTLQALNLPRTNVIYAGGGNLFILAPAQNDGDEIPNLQENINQWLRKKFQGKVFLALTYQDSAVEAVQDLAFRDVWNEGIGKVNQQKTAKFRSQIEELLEPQASYEPCRVCHRDDTENLKPLNPKEPDSVLACPTCRDMFALGGELFEVGSLVRSHQKELQDAKPAYRVDFEISDCPENHIYYHLFKGNKPLIDHPEQVLLINNWSISDYTFSRFEGKTAPLLLGNYYRRDLDGFMTAEDFAETAENTGCIPRVGYLRMDVDHLGKLFAKGLGDHYSLPRLAGLSRQMSYFFKTYLNSLAANRQDNLPEPVIQLNNDDRPNLLFIYAGGDDLFVSGAWNELTDFAFDVYQAFRAYTGKHPDITLSGGISLATPKFPLYQAAAESGEAESKAKGNGRDSLSLFGFPFKWKEWFGTDLEGQLSQQIIEAIESRKEEEDYWKDRGSDDNKPTLIGVMPFVTRIQQQNLQGNYSRSFVRNLLAAAQLQEQRIKELEDKRKTADYQYQLQDFRYYLHLPQIAYTLARLPRKAFDDDDENYRGFRKSLKSPYNAPYFRAIATWIELLSRNP